MAGRGELTSEVQQIAEAFLGREIASGELRLYPYLQYVMLNERRIDPAKINQEERDIIRLLREAGHLEGGATGLSMTRQFWDFLSRVLWVAYATYDCRDLEA